MRLKQHFKTTRDMETINTTAGAITVSETPDNNIIIRLSSAEGRRKNVTVTVINDINGDEVKLTWIK